MKLKYFSICIIIFCNCLISYSQHTDRFKELTNKIIAEDTTQYKNYYSNDSIKDSGLVISYKTPSYTYSKKIGEHISYYRTGELKSKVLYDAFGNELSAIFFNRDSTTWWKSETLKIDTNLTNYQEYFLVENSIIITKKIKEYKYGREIGKMYLRTQGIVTNKKKIGDWKIYDEYGAIEDEIENENKQLKYFYKLKQ